MMLDQFSAVNADRTTPWGTDNDSETLATSAEMLEIAGLANWNVQLRPEYTLDHDGKVIPVPGRFATVTSSGQVLGSGLSSRYKVLQAEDAFGFGDAIVDSGEAKWSRAGRVRNGETIFGCMELSGLDIDVPGDGPIKPYLFIVNSFGGWTPYMGLLAYVRPRCINTFQMAYGTGTSHKFTIRHTGTLDGKLTMAREALGIAFRHNEQVATVVNKLATTKVVDQQVQDIFKALWPLSDEASDSVKERSMFTKAWDNYQASETLDGIRGTAWGALNAVTEVVDHLSNYRPVSDGIQAGDTQQLRTLSTMLEQGERRKEQALRQLVALSR